MYLEGRPVAVMRSITDRGASLHYVRCVSHYAMDFYQILYDV